MHIETKLTKPNTLISSIPPISCDLNVIETGIIGTGNSARALAAYLSSKGHNVHLLARTRESLDFLGPNCLVTAEGKINGIYTIASASCDIASFLNTVEVIFIATITTAYKEVALKLAPYLKEHHKIILFSAKLGGTLLFEEALRNAATTIPTIIETDALFACRIDIERNTISVRGFKGWTLFSSSTSTKTKANAAVIHRFFPDLSPAKNIIQRGLTDFGALAHAPIAIANMNLISRKTPFRFYYDGLTDETIRLLEALELEFREIASAYGAELIPMKELLNRYYTCDTANLYTAMTSVPNYRNSVGPDSLSHRFLYEDICSTLVPARHLALLARINVPIITALISITSVLTQKALSEEGRSLQSLGLSQMKYEEVEAYVNS